MKKHLLLLTSLSFLLSNYGIAQKLSEQQKQELYEKGIITVYNENDEKRGHYEVNLVPGTDQIRHDASQKWHAAAEIIAEIMEFDQFLQSKVKDEIKAGLDYMKEKSWDSGLLALYTKFLQLKESIKPTQKSFGGNFQLISNMLTFGADTIKAGASVYWGIIAGGAYAVYQPTKNLFTYPLRLGNEAIVKGTFWPCIRYSWNGAAWRILKEKDLPSETDLSVTFVPFSKGD